MNESKKSNLAPSSVAALLFSIPLYFTSSCLGNYGGDLVNSWSSKSWPTTKGIIEKAELKHYRTKSKHEARHYTVYYPVITYRYAVKGKIYKSQRITYKIGNRNRLENNVIHTSTSRSKARKTIDLYDPGSDVTVYYKQSSPGVSVLEPGPGTWYYYFYTLIGFIGTLVTGGIVLYAVYYTVTGFFRKEQHDYND